MRRYSVLDTFIIPAFCCMRMLLQYCCTNESVDVNNINSKLVYIRSWIVIPYFKFFLIHRNLRPIKVKIYVNTWFHFRRINFESTSRIGCVLCASMYDNLPTRCSKSMTKQKLYYRIGRWAKLIQCDVFVIVFQCFV